MSNKCFLGIIITCYLKLIYVENRMLPIHYQTTSPNPDDFITAIDQDKDQHINEKVVGVKAFEEADNDDYGFEIEKKRSEQLKKPCAIVVLSNIQNPDMQSLIRKYRYDSKGILIPNSVKYYIKLPQGLGSSPVLVPVNDKAFSPLGGFVRYYKEVPPIPHSW